MRFSILIGTVGMVVASCFGNAGNQDSNEIDAFVTSKMAEAGIMGIGTAVLVDRKIVWSQGYGYSDYKKSVPFTPDTIMNVGSIAKTFTGVAMMKAVQDGKLSLDADINMYLPFRVVNPRHPNSRITLRHLATHTSGITDRWEVYSKQYHYGEESPLSLEAFLKGYFESDGQDYSQDNYNEGKPGQHRDYSNIGAALAGYIVERATGEPLNAYTRQHIFEPLGMKNTGWFLSEVDMTRHSTLFVSQNGFTIPIQHYSGTTYPDGGIRTSVSDLSKFFAVLLNEGEFSGGQILERKTIQEMTRFQFSDGNRPENFPAEDGNSGLFWRTKFNGTRMGHGGNDPGLQTEMLCNLGRDVGLILFINTSLSGEESRISGEIFDALWKFSESKRNISREAIQVGYARSSF